MRAPFQVLVFPYKWVDKQIQYCLFRRSDNSIWQGIAGGGENSESPEQAALRESFEEAGISSAENLIRLQTISSIRKTEFKDFTSWDENIYVIPEFSFGILTNVEIKLSKEHNSYRWLNFEDSINILKYDGNKTAIWELNQRLLKQNERL